ncbi:MAG: AlpA family phage regulatory protein [Deltaproteobacteria bacterium]|nr:AlpA family phage regulatory protein [Deltaproteobacteria bacterium]
MLCNTRIVRVNELSERLGVSRVTLWRWERKGLLPRKLRLGPNTVGWLESEIEEWLSSRPPVRPHASLAEDC